MTPKEAAQFASPPVQRDKVREFLLTASIKEIQEFIHLIPAMDYIQEFNIARVALDVKISEEAAKSASKLERFTWWLVCLTGALIFYRSRSDCPDGLWALEIRSSL